jgi:hypothetical protein
MPDEMHPDFAALLKRLQAIEERQDRLEAKLQDRKKEIHEPQPPQPAATPPHPLPSFLKAEVKAEPAEEIPTVLPVDKPATPEVDPAGPSVPPHRPEDKQIAAPAPSPHSLELAVGLKWAGWIGAIILAIGAGLGIEFAYVHGWFGHIPIELRLFLMSLGGFALIAAGEVVYRRINVISAAALFGAGVSILFLISYAGNTYYGAYSYQMAFVYALLTTLIGSGVAIRGRLVSIAVLSQVGGLIGPIVLSTGQPPGIPLLGYVLMLQMVALILALWGRTPKWWLLRVLSLVGTSWWVLVSLLEGHWSKGLGNEVLWFAVVYAAVYQGELLRSALLAGSGEGRGGEGETGRAGEGAMPAFFAPSPLRPFSPSLLGWGTLFSLLVTAGLTAVALHVFYDYDSAALRGGSTLLLAAFCLAGGFLWRGSDNRLVHTLAIGYLIQGMALLLLFVPVTFTSIWISLAWVVLSLAFVSIGARFDRDLARGAALAAWLLAVGRLMIDAAQAGPSDPAGQTWIVLGGHPILAYTMVAWLVSIAGQAVAWLLQTKLFIAHAERLRETPWQPWAFVISVAASIVWVVASLDGLPHLGATLAIVLYAWLLFGFDFVPQKLHLAAHAVAILLFAAMKWAWVDGLLDRSSVDWNATEYIPVLNPFMGMGVVVAASVASMVRLKKAEFDDLLSAYLGRGLSSAAFSFTLAILVLAILTIGLSFEADRLVEASAAAGHQIVWPVTHLKLFAFTILWEIAVLVLAFIGRRVGFQTVLPWILFLIVAGKFLLIDMLLMRMTAKQGPAPVTVLVNLQMLTALLLLVGFFCLRHLSPLPVPNIPQLLSSSIGFFDVETGKKLQPHGGVVEPAQVLGLLANSVALLILLLAGTLEIDRAFASSLAAGFTDPRLAGEVAISIFWSLFAIAAVLAGFRFWSAGLRLFGLILFGVTVLKVLLIDLREVRFGYRILSLLGLGLLLLATSVVYGKLGAKRLQQRTD